MLVKGDKLIVTKDVASFLKEGEIVEVICVDGDVISFKFGNGMHKGVMNTAECEEHFEKYEEPTKIIARASQERIDYLIDNSEIKVDTIFDKCTIVSCKLPSGFVIVESSPCAAPEIYDEKIGIEICMKKIEEKLWELESYRIKEEVYAYEEEYCDCDDCDMDCESCDCCEDCEELDECLDTDLDCDDCENQECLFNSMSDNTIDKRVTDFLTLLYNGEKTQEAIEKSELNELSTYEVLREMSKVHSSEETLAKIFGNLNKNLAESLLSIKEMEDELLAKIMKSR